MIRELLKTGNWSQGKINKTIIKQVLRNFSETDRAPVVRGHKLNKISDTDKNLGWVEKLWGSNDLGTLVGKINFNNDGKTAYFDDGFKNCSSGLQKNKDGEWYLHHLGLLSAIPPSVKDLKVLEYSENNQKIIVYRVADDRLEIIYPSREKIKNFSEEATMPDNNNLAIQLAEEKKVVELEKNDLEKKHANLEIRLKELEIKNKEKEEEFNEKIKKYEDQELEEKKEKLKETVAGKIPKQQAEELLSFCDRFPVEKMNFADNKKKDFFEVLGDIFKNIDKQVAEGEMNFGEIPDVREKEIPVTDYIMNI